LTGSVAGKKFSRPGMGSELPLQIGSFPTVPGLSWKALTWTPYWPGETVTNDDLCAVVRRPG
jgi:hypothetical protein